MIQREITSTAKYKQTLSGRAVLGSLLTNDKKSSREVKNFFTAPNSRVRKTKRTVYFCPDCAGVKSPRQKEEERLIREAERKEERRRQEALRKEYRDNLKRKCESEVYPKSVIIDNSLTDNIAIPIGYIIASLIPYGIFRLLGYDGVNWFTIACLFGGILSAWIFPFKKSSIVVPEHKNIKELKPKEYSDLLYNYNIKNPYKTKIVLLNLLLPVVGWFWAIVLASKKYEIVFSDSFLLQMYLISGNNKYADIYRNKIRDANSENQNDPKEMNKSTPVGPSVDMNEGECHGILECNAVWASIKITRASSVKSVQWHFAKATKLQLKFYTDGIVASKDQKIIEISNVSYLPISLHITKRCRVSDVRAFFMDKLGINVTVNDAHAEAQLADDVGIIGDKEAINPTSIGKLSPSIPNQTIACNAYPEHSKTILEVPKTIADSTHSEQICEDKDESRIEANAAGNRSVMPEGYFLNFRSKIGSFGFNEACGLLSFKNDGSVTIEYQVLALGVFKIGEFKKINLHFSNITSIQVVKGLFPKLIIRVSPLELFKDIQGDRTGELSAKIKQSELKKADVIAYMMNFENSKKINEVSSQIRETIISQQKLNEENKNSSKKTIKVGSLEIGQNLAFSGNQISKPSSISQSKHLNLFMMLVGIVFALFGGLILIAAFADIIKGDSSTSKGTLLLIILIFSGITASGVYFFYTHRIKRKLKIALDKEKQILSIISAHNGRISALQLSMSSNISVEDSDKLLSSMCLNGQGSVEATDTGEVVYVFSAFH